MNFRSMQAKLASAAVAALVAGTLGLITSPASAADADGYVSGWGPWGGDWGNEGTLSTDSHDSSNATCLWQKILWAEGKLDYTGIDGHFGPNTDSATKSLQSDWGLSTDGLVGGNTFGRADNELEYVSGNTSDGLWLTYDGDDNNFKVHRNAQGNYRFYANGTYRYAGYHYNSCD